MDIEISDVLEEALETSKLKEFELIKLKVAYNNLLQKYTELKEKEDDVKNDE